MNRLGKILSWFIIVFWCILIAVWTFYKFIYQEDTTLNKSTEFLNPDTARESIVRIENEVGTTWYGTGFFITPNKIATNIHVIAQPGPIVVQTIHKKEIVRNIFENGTQVESHNSKVTKWNVEGVSAFDVKNDLAILKVDMTGTPIQLGNSGRVKKNEPITIMGFPFNKFRVKNGYVYSIRKSDKWLRSDIVIGGGSSGSPVLNERGQVIGIHSYIQLDCSYSLASPSNLLKKLLKRSDNTEPLEEWHKRDEIRSYAHYIKGQNRYNEEDYHQSIVELDKAIQLDSDSIYAYTKRGDAKSRLAETDHRLGNIEKAKNLYISAIEDYKFAIKNNPKKADAYRGMAIAKFELGDRKDAILYYKRAIEINPRHEVFYIIQGNKKIEQGDKELNQGNFEIAQQLYVDAIEHYGFAIERSPKSFFGYLKRADAKSKLGNSKAAQSDVVGAQQYLQDAIDEYDYAIDLNPDSMLAFSGRAHTNYLFGEFEKDQQNLSAAILSYKAAINDWNYCIGTIPEDNFKKTKLANVYRNIGSSRIQIGKIETKRKENEKAKLLYTDALEDFTHAIQVNPKDSYAYSDRGWVKYLLGKSEALAGNTENALNLYVAAIIDSDVASRIEPNNVYALHNRGVTKSALGNIEDAIIDFDRAIQINPRYARAYYERGIAKETLGHKEEAKADLEKAKELGPNIEQ